MKLYATTTSERASKGQGGKWLDIEIMGENNVVIARLTVTSTYPHEYNIDVYPVVYPYPDKRCQSSCLKLDVKGHGYKLTRKVSKEETEGQCQNRDANGNACWDCEVGGGMGGECGSADREEKGKQKKGDSGKDGICVACQGKNPEGCTYC